MILNGLIDDLRIIKDGVIYRNPYFPPVRYQSTSCREQTPPKPCVVISNDEVFDTWTVQNNKTHDAVTVEKRYNRQSVIITTESGTANYVGLIRPDVVVFDFPLNSATALKLDVDVKMHRVDQNL